MYNRIIQFNDFKTFRNEKEVVILDIENGKLVKVDERTLKIIQNNNLSKEELFQKSKKYFNEEEFNSLVNAMENAGFLKYVDSKNESSIETYTKENIVGITLMLVQGCNLACSYCFGDEGSYCDSGKMSKETAFKAIDYLFEHSDADKVLITFFGGEPLLAVDLMKEIISYCKTKDKNVGYSMTTNGTLLNDEVNKLIVENKISTIISIDGDKEKNDKNRYHKDGTGSYDQTVKNTKELRKEYGLTSRATLTPGNLDMVDTFNHLNGLGFKNIPMTPANNLTSDAEFVEYINSEIELIEYAKELIHSDNCSKVRKMTFIYSALLSLHRGVYRQFGCGAGIRDVAIDIHGDIYPCHRFVSYKETCLGNVYDTYQENEEKREKYLEKAQINNLNTREVCSKCWVRKYCAGGCVAGNYEENGGLLSQPPRECFHQQVFYEKLIYLYMELSEEEKKELFGEKY